MPRLPLLAATLLAPGFYRFTNVPRLKDVRTMSNLLRILGAKIDESGHELIIDTTQANNVEAPYDLVKTMRASFYVLGALLVVTAKRVSHCPAVARGDRVPSIYI
jgi:UDP-N-acetylglucosamine 1-carboxyvinyltransferase